ncbi:hypothetical protein BJY01DRAFT_240264 [Aspergillus pseudoustus]|uniref:Rhodopsin domain-containing protein n=1 Tax=Aspergillus pseudoustus TaxID=1810923 RepID=A0ABR4IT61_9EURO
MCGHPDYHTMFVNWAAYGRLSCLFVLSLCLVRLSQLAFIYRLSKISNSKKWAQYAVLTVGTFVAGGSFTLMCCFIFACQPISKTWDVSLKGKCIDRSAIYLSVAIFNIFSDIFLLGAPLPLLASLQVSKNQRIRSAILFGLACIRTIITGAVRLWLTIPLLGTADLTYAIAPIALLVYVHLSNSVIPLDKKTF